MIYQVSNKSLREVEGFAAAAHLGRGAFETIRVRTRGGEYVVIGLDRHLKRLRAAADALGLCSLDEADLREYFACILSREPALAHESDLLLRIVSYSDTVIISLEPWAANWSFENPIRLKSYQGRREAAEFKHCSSLLSTLAREAACQEGFDEALFVSNDRYIFEGAWSNIFWFDEQGTLHTPSEHVLPGVTRSFVLELQESEGLVRCENCSLEQVLESATEVFVTQATHGIQPVSQLDDTFFETPRFGAVGKLYDRYNQLVDTDMSRRLLIE